jgi:predicted ferric reductase
MNMNIWYIISYVLLGLSLICFSISIYLYYKYKYKNNKIVKGRVSTKDLFQQLILILIESNVGIRQFN